MKILFSKERIAQEVSRLGREITAEYEGKDLVLIGVLKGSYIFLADLSRAIETHFEIDFVRLASYGNGTESTGVVELRKDKEISVRGRHVLIVEDIVDSGYSLDYLYNKLQLEEPASVRICTMIDKRARRKIEIEADYVGISMEDGFIVGYGLDYGEKYRNLPDICVFEDDDLSEYEGGTR